MPKSPLHRILNSLPDKTRAEIIGGQLIVQPPPAIRHNRVVRQLLKRLPSFDDWGGAPGGWVILQDPGVNVPAHLATSGEHEFVEPDLAGWRTERMPAEPDVTFIDTTPDWVCEVLSGNAKHDREVKQPLYAAMLVKHRWLIDPKALTLEGHTLTTAGVNAGAYELTQVAQRAQVVHAEPFSTLELDLSTLWLKPTG